MKRINWNIIFPLAAIILLGWLMWAIYNRYFPIQEGWMQYYALITNKGGLPYKDFYYFTQPIPLFISQGILKFGNDFILYRYYGMIERTISILAIYYLLSKHFSPTSTFIAVVASAFMYQSFKIDVLYNYFQTTQLFFLLSLICLQRSSGSKHAWLYDFLVGLLASLAFFSKQSSGLLVALFLLFMMVWNLSVKSFVMRVLCFLFGWGIPTSGILFWLIKNHIFYDYLNQVFGGVSSKGSLVDILFALWVRNSALMYYSVVLLGLLILFLLWKYKKFDINIITRSPSELSQYNYFLLFIFPAFMIGGFILGANLQIKYFINLLESHYLSFWLYFTFFLITIAAIVIGLRWISRKKLPFSKSLSELVLASFIWTYSAGLSGQLEIYATLLGTALVLAFLLDRVQVKWKHYYFFLISTSCLVVLLCVTGKTQIPLSWWGWMEYGHSENVTSAIPALKGFRLSTATVGIYDQIYIDIMNNTNSSDYVYTFPFIPFFNYVTGRVQPTFSPVHYFDVCPDYIAVLDAAKLLENPPRMIIYMEIPEPVFRFHELSFRNGQPSGQRSLVAAINDIIEKYNYRKIDSFVTPGWDWPIYVWLKP
jgi:hypothetical protein